MKAWAIRRKLHGIIVMMTACMLMASPASAGPDRTVWTGTVTYVVDGDTVHVRPPDGGKPISVRVYGIDAPEICQAGGEASRDALVRRALGRQVVVSGKARDSYGRLLAQLHEGGEDLGRWMVGQGQAWSHRFHRDAGPYGDEQQRARAGRRGLFAAVPGKEAASPVYPADFRKAHGSCHYGRAGKRRAGL
jgi:micrococcal nuclease